VKYRLRLIATIEEAETPTFYNGGIDEQEDWLVERLGAEFVFETPQSLHNFIEQFSIALGGKE